MAETRKRRFPIKAGSVEVAFEGSPTSEEVEEIEEFFGVVLRRARREAELADDDAILRVRGGLIVGAKQG